MKPLLLYALHSSQLYGTERMSLATASGLTGDFDIVVFAPPGAALEEAARLGLQPVAFNGARDLAKKARPFFAQRRPVACVSTAVPQSVIFCGWSAWYRTPATHLHVVHGGADEALSYGRKRWLMPLPIQFVAVSAYVRDRLHAHGIPAHRVTVIENFLTPEAIAGAPRRPAFTAPGIRSVAIVSRVDPIKRVDLLFEMLDAAPALGALSFDVYGSGWDLERLRERAGNYPSVTLHGFVPDVPARLATADLLLHLCPEEPFGLVILEAIAAGVPVLVPSAGGAGSLVAHGTTGFTFAANDPRALAAALDTLRAVPAATLNAIVAAARTTLDRRFSAVGRTADYRRLLTDVVAREAA